MVSSSTLTNNLNKFKRLSQIERQLLLKAALLLPLIHLALQLLGYYRVRRMIEKLIPLKTIVTPVTQAESFQRARAIARIVSIAAGHGIYKATCLRRSTLLWGFLRREGIRSEICFGVRMNGHQLEAHAWVEYLGRIVNDSLNVHDQYTALREAFPPTRTGL